MHQPASARRILFRALAEAVAPGGTLLIVGHDVSDADAGGHRAHLRELMFGVDEVLSAIDGAELEVGVAESRERDAPAAHDSATPVRDVVVRATRPVRPPAAG